VCSISEGLGQGLGVRRAELLIGSLIVEYSHEVPREGEEKKKKKKKKRTLFVRLATYADYADHPSSKIRKMIHHSPLPVSLASANTSPPRPGRDDACGTANARAFR